MARVTKWELIGQENPERSLWYIERFQGMAEQGMDLDGEARLVDAMVPRGARVLDAGCGPGRVGGELARRGHCVVGVDVDPVLIEEARRVFPDSEWVVGSLEDFELVDPQIGTASVPADAGFDLAIIAGIVMTFLAPETEVAVLRRVAEHLADQGRIVVGFGGGRGYEFADFFADVEEAGLTVDSTYETWDLRPWTAESGFLVAILSRGAV